MLNYFQEAKKSSNKIFSRISEISEEVEGNFEKLKDKFKDKFEKIENDSKERISVPFFTSSLFNLSLFDFRSFYKIRDMNIFLSYFQKGFYVSFCVHLFNFHIFVHLRKS